MLELIVLISKHRCSSMERPRVSLLPFSADHSTRNEGADNTVKGVMLLNCRVIAGDEMVTWVSSDQSCQEKTRKA